MLIVVVIIWILAAALLPKLMSAQDKAKDKASYTAVSSLLKLMMSGNGYYPPHTEDFSKKPYLINKGISWIDYPDKSQWGSGSWVTYFDWDSFKDGTGEKEKTIMNILSKNVERSDLSGLPFRDGIVFDMWFTWNLGLLLKSSSIVNESDPLYDELYNNWLVNIKNTNPDLPKSKQQWWFFVVWLDHTPSNWWLKINDESFISEMNNDLLRDAYVNFAFVWNDTYFLNQIVKTEEGKEKFIKALLKSLKNQNPDLVSTLSWSN